MLLASSALAWERGRLGAAMFRRRRQAPFEQHVPLAQELQLPALGRGRAGIQCRHLDAAHRAGLAGADRAHRPQRNGRGNRSEEHTSELQSLMRISYAVFCLKKKKTQKQYKQQTTKP